MYKGEISQLLGKEDFFIVGSPTRLEKVKPILTGQGEISQLLGKEDFFIVVSLARLEKVKPILTGCYFKYFYDLKQNQVCSAIFY